jgi:hypothetical protein
MPYHLNQSQRVTGICRDELDLAVQRIEERLSEMELRPVETGPDAFEGIRRFYEELSEHVWTESDEQYLAGMKDTDPASIKRMMREAYRHSPVIPVPSFGYLIHLAKRLEAGAREFQPGVGSNAVSAADRERLANLLDQQLKGAADEIISALRLSQPNCELVIQRLEAVQGQIISQLTPLV